MTDYRVCVADRTYDVSIQNDMLVVNGDQIAFNMESLNGNGLHILRQPTRNIEAYLEPNRGGLYDIQIDGKHMSAEVVLGFQSSRKTSRNNTGKVLSPMPGLIVDFLVKKGDLVKKGETLLVQEAMKMQMKIRATCSGIISGIFSSAGSQVDKGLLLVSIDPVA